jgi:hypothetical protein
MIIRNLPDLGIGHVYGPSVATDIHTEEDVSGEEEDLQLSDEDFHMDTLEGNMDDCCE